MKTRLVLLAVGLGLWATAIAGRLVDLQVRHHDRYSGMARRQQIKEVELDGPRGTIYDARGRELAVSVEVDSAYGVPAELPDVDTLLARLEGIPGVDERKIRRGYERSRYFVWLARKLDEGWARELESREIPGVYFRQESKRYYPMGASASSVLGFVGTDHDGLAGLEARYDPVLAGDAVVREVLLDAHQRELQLPALAFREATPGNDLYLTIDASIQHRAERELERAMERYGARRGAVVVLDPKTGAVLAMASAPAFDPNRFLTYPEERWRNGALSVAYEPGSTLKLATAAAALETGLVDPFETFDCEMGSITLEGRRIRDHKPFGLLTFREVIAKSSNVGAIKAGRRVGAEGLHRQLVAFGLGEPTGVDLPGENAGMLRPIDRWGRLTTAYVSFGQGVSLNTLQLANMFAAVANGGRRLEPYVVAGVGRGGTIDPLRPKPRVLARPVRPEIARSLGLLLEAVVAEGTGKAAAIPGYRVAGKTGTAQIAVEGGYATDRHLASFVGYAPASDPAVVVAVVVEDPKPLYHGGEVAAPVFAAVVRPTLVYLGVPPHREAPETWPGERPATVAAAPPAHLPAAGR